MGKRKINFNNYKFIDSALANEDTYYNYLNQLKRIATSIFEWVNLPESMNSEYLEKCLYYFGSATFLYDDKYGFINTNCASGGNINIYGYPNAFHCFSYGYQEFRILYTGLKNQDNLKDNKQCVLVMNNIDRCPTQPQIEMYAYRLYEAQRSADVNIKAQKTPVLIVGTDKQRLTLENLYNQYNGNQPFIFGDKDQLSAENMKALKTEAPFVADKLEEYKKEIWNEVLTFLGINNIQTIKKERVLTDEVNSNNEVINLNLQAMLYPRQKACKQFNELFGFTGTKKEISVRVRSDLHNIIKQAESVISDYIDNTITEETNKNLPTNEVINNE